MLSRAPLPYKMANVTNSVVSLFTQQLLFYSCARSVGVLTQGPLSHSHTACCTHGGGVHVEFSQVGWLVGWLVVVGCGWLWLVVVDGC